MKSYLFVGLLFVVITAFNSQAQSLQQYRWTSIEAEGQVDGRHENGFVAFDNKFYLLGGRGIKPVNVFDPQTNRWESRATSPIEIHHFQALVYGKAIYLLGAMTGRYPKETPLGNIWIYYPEADQWEKGPAIPVEFRRGGAGAVIYQDKFYLVGGIDYGHTSGTNNHFSSFDPKTGEWQALTKAPTIRDHFSAVVVDDKLYCIGGRNTSFHEPDNFSAFFGATNPYVDVYDFKTGQWISLPDELPVPTAAGGVVALGKHILYIGGESGQAQAHNQTQCLDTETGEWTILAPLVRGRHGTNVIVHEGTVYVAAGSENRGGGNMGSIEMFSADHSWHSLFNGENLDDWEIKCTEMDRDRRFWYVEDGLLVSNSIGSTDHEYIWLQSKDEFDNFELRLKYQVGREMKGNAGVQIRSRYDGKTDIGNGIYGKMHGPQVEIDPFAPWRNGYLYDETTGYKKWINPALDKGHPTPEQTQGKVIFYFEDEGPAWNDLRIVCKGNHIQTFVNNIQVSDYNGDGVLNDEIHRKYRVGENGHIALQLHKKDENLVRFKDIELRKLP